MWLAWSCSCQSAPQLRPCIACACLLTLVLAYLCVCMHDHPSKCHAGFCKVMSASHCCGQSEHLQALAAFLWHASGGLPGLGCNCSNLRCTSCHSPTHLTGLQWFWQKRHCCTPLCCCYEAGPVQAFFGGTHTLLMKLRGSPSLAGWLCCRSNAIATCTRTDQGHGADSCHWTFLAISQVAGCCLQ